ncbi:MAG: hypothetical protein P8184_06910 [Calditrichia bacterium]
MTWNLVNFGSGVYYFKMEAGNFVEVRKGILIKLAELEILAIGALAVNVSNIRAL